MRCVLLCGSLWAAIRTNYWEAGESINRGPLTGNEKARQIYGNPTVFKKCRADKIAYVVALASGERLEFGALVDDEYDGQGHARSDP
jgi:hypothetical protein